MRCCTLLRGLPRRLAPADRGGAAPARGRTTASWPRSSRSGCRSPVLRSRGQGAGRSRHAVFRAARLSPVGRARPQLLAELRSRRCTISRPAIDVLMESAADAYGPALAGVLLTGANDDGAAGLARIHAGGRPDRRAGPGRGRRSPTMPQRRHRRRTHPTTCSPCAAFAPLLAATGIRRMPIDVESQAADRRRPAGEPAGARSADPRDDAAGLPGRVGRRGACRCCWSTSSRWPSSTCRCRA